MKNARRPLEGVRVIEVGIALAGPFAGSLLAELGAHVIKIERPGGGDPMRLMGPSIDDVALWWGVAARAKKCIDLNLKNEDEREIFLSLVKNADALVENYRPGVLDRLGLGWSKLREVNPSLVMLSISGFGQTGPMSGRPGFGKIAEAMSGIVTLTGKPDDVPMHIGFSLADTSTGLMGVFGLALAMYQRDVAGQAGTRIDVALFEPLLRMAECQFALRTQFDRIPTREGTNDPYGWGMSGNEGALQSIQCADAHWIMVPTQAAKEALIIAASMKVRETLLALKTQGIEAALVHDGWTIATDSYFKERKDVQELTDPQIGKITVVGEIAKTYLEPKLPLFRATKPDADRASILSPENTVR